MEVQEKRGQDDTRPEAARVQLQLLRQASVARRFGLARSLSRLTSRLAQGAVRRSLPGAGEAERRLAFVRVHYGRGLADRLAGAPDQETPMADPDIVAAVTPVIEALEALGVPYRIGGSVASSAYGIARSTLDVDLVADLQQENVDPLAARLSGDYYLDAEMIRDAIEDRSSFNLVHLASMVKIDLFLVQSGRYDREAFARARCETVEEGDPPRQWLFVSPEDLVLRKLDWYRQGGEVSERQWGDVLGVLQVQATSLDMAYLRRWAISLGLADLLERALVEAGEGGE